MNMCIIIPVYNESHHIGPLVELLCAQNHDVVVIDDGSTDGTGAIAKEKGAVVLRYEQRSGKGYSLRNGFKYALGHDYEAVITMDGDGQHDGNDIDQFVETAKEHKISILAGNRMTDSKGMPLIRLYTNRFMSWLISVVLKQSIIDTQCGYRYIHCDILRKLDLTCRDFEIETEILMKASKKGFKIYNVPVKTIYRDEESKINPFKDTIRFFSYFIKEIFFSKA